MLRLIVALHDTLTWKYACEWFSSFIHSNIHHCHRKPCIESTDKRDNLNDVKRKINAHSHSCIERASEYLILSLCLHISQRHKYIRVRMQTCRQRHTIWSIAHRMIKLQRPFGFLLAIFMQRGWIYHILCAMGTSSNEHNAFYSLLFQPISWYWRKKTVRKKIRT